MEGGLETAAAVEARAGVMVPGLEERETVVAMGAEATAAEVQAEVMVAVAMEARMGAQRVATEGMARLGEEAAVPMGARKEEGSV